MELITLVTACSLAADPKLMHALVWQHSGAEPWSILVKGEASPRVYANARQAMEEIRARPPTDSSVRVGLAGVPVDLSQIRTALFLPCRNVAAAAAQIAKLADRCKTNPRLNSDPVFCAVAVYRGSWERPDTEFARVVQASVMKGDAPNFDMSDDAELTSPDITSEVLPRENESSKGSAIVHDERERGWSSALFPAKPKQSDSTAAAVTSDNASSHDQHSALHIEQHPSALNPLMSGLFVPKSVPTHD